MKMEEENGIMQPQDKECLKPPEARRGQEGMIVNFMCQLGWATGYLDIWSNIILGVSVRVFWMRLTFKSVDLE